MRPSILWQLGVVACRTAAKLAAKLAVAMQQIRQLHKCEPTGVEVSIVGISIIEVSSIAVAMVADAVVAEAHVEVTVVAAAAHRVPVKE